MRGPSNKKPPTGWVQFWGGLALLFRGKTRLGNLREWWPNLSHEIQYSEDAGHAAVSRMAAVLGGDPAQSDRDDPASDQGGCVMKLKMRVLWVFYVLLLAAGICTMLKAAAVRDRQYMERFGGMTR